jgi:pilus assembly protein TadC
MNRTPSRFRRVVITKTRNDHAVVSKNIALDRLNRGIAMPSVLRMLQEIENMDDLVPADPPTSSED